MPRMISWGAMREQMPIGEYHMTRLTSKIVAAKTASNTLFSTRASSTAATIAQPKKSEKTITPSCVFNVRLG